MELVIQVTPVLGAALLAPDATGAARAILDRLEQEGVVLAPQPSGADEAGPPEFFSGDVADEAAGEALATALLELDGIVAAYLKPDVRPPGLLMDPAMRGPYGTPAYPARAPRELIVRARPEAELWVDRDGRIGGGEKAASLHSALEEASATLWPLLEDPPARVSKDRSALAGWFRVYPTTDDAAERVGPELTERLLEAAALDAAYLKPPATLPVLPPSAVGAAAEAGPEPLGDPDDFLPRQGYLGPAPGGIGAEATWELPGGDGAGVRIVDVEAEWRFTHEDLHFNPGGLVGGRPPGDVEWRNHGTNVIGVLGGAHNGRGVSGICAGAALQGVSFFGEGWGTAAAIRKAADTLRAGDILLIEMMRAGPNAPRDARARLPGRLHRARLLAGRLRRHRLRRPPRRRGRGGRRQRRPGSRRHRSYAGFAGRANPFARGELDSGAILVGAGAPPPGTHGADYGPDRSRMAFSNFGGCIDAQGWGREVTTTGGLGRGSDTLRPGPVEDRWYTDRFSGTSSAAPMVAGVLACVQGVLRAAGHAPLTPAQARAALRETGSPQAGDGRQRIGNRPDLGALIPWAMEQAEIARAHRKARRRGMRVTITIEDGDERDVSITGRRTRGDEDTEGPYIKGPYIKGPSLVIPREDGTETELNIDTLVELVESGGDPPPTPGG